MAAGGMSKQKGENKMDGKQRAQKEMLNHCPQKSEEE